MKIKFKKQGFQEDAARTVCHVFLGQPFSDPARYVVDPGKLEKDQFAQMADITGFRNSPVAISDEQILKNLQTVQMGNGIVVSETLERTWNKSREVNLTIEMETGVGKTYTYIKTMYELNKNYGWSKFIVVVPSVAIREGVYKSFEITQEHFAQEYHKKIRFFIYNSGRLNELEHFASDNNINVMIINSQAFNSKGADARRIRMKLDEFRSRRPIDVLAATNPILIIDEPQSVEGAKTKEGLRDFNPLLILRYSATHRKDSIYNMVYRLDAVDAYNMKLVKKIAVTGVSQKGTTATDGYVFLESVNLSQQNPTATLVFEARSGAGVRSKRATVSEGYDLYAHSGQLEEYRDNFVVKAIDGRDGSVEFLNGKRLYCGDAYGFMNEETIRRIQIRETIQSHLERERRLFSKGIKVLSLFFIDEVAKYRLYDKGVQKNGIYAEIFEEEYRDALENFQREFGDDKYVEYLKAIPVEKTHAGYFSIDKKSGNMIDGKRTREGVSDDVDAYDLIMKNKELLLDRDPLRSPVRFIFSHSALREGWDNPNVFQICTLKQSGSDVRRRQEVGRGLRLCVNQEGERIDGEDVHDVNVLTIIASESYQSFAEGLQKEIAETIYARPLKVNAELFTGRTLVGSDGLSKKVDKDFADEIVFELIVKSYVDKKGALTELYRQDQKDKTVAGKLCDELKPYAESIVEVLNTVYDPNSIIPIDRNKYNVEIRVDDEKMRRSEFQELWKRINAKSYYLVDFTPEELRKKAIEQIENNLRITPIEIVVEDGSMQALGDGKALKEGVAFKSDATKRSAVVATPNQSVKYDLVGKIAEQTTLTRKAVVEILMGISEAKFQFFKYNPEEFISKVSNLINAAKATVIVNRISYSLIPKNQDKTATLDPNALERYDTEIFTESQLKGTLDKDVIKTPKRHLYDHLLYDSEIEKKFAEKLENASEVAVYVKLPRGFYISTPVGKYNPDWAIAFNEGDVKHVYFVAETKGDVSTMALRPIEQAKIDCAKKHFQLLEDQNVRYDVVDSFDMLLTLVKGA